MNKRELWEAFIKTGSVRDYLKYKKAEERPLFDNREDNLTEFSQEFFEEVPDEDS